MSRKMPLIVVGLVVFGGVIFYLYSNTIKTSLSKELLSSKFNKNNNVDSKQQLHPMSIKSLRERRYSDGGIKIEKELKRKNNYKRYIASYKSDGLKIFGLLTIPDGDIPQGGWPVIIFNHGFIQPNEYETTKRYEEYIDAFARSGYVVFKSDYRGHGNSEGQARGNYFTSDYVIDVINATLSVQKLPEVNPEKIGMWGHSMGGNITMKNLVITDNIKVAVIWAGVVGSYDDILNNWSSAEKWRQFDNQKFSKNSFLEKFGTYNENQKFWSSIDPYTFIADIKAPVQIHHGIADAHVPFSFSENFKNILEKNGKLVELYSYEGADHNLSGDSFDLAMERSIKFFDRYLK